MTKKVKLLVERFKTNGLKGLTRGERISLVKAKVIPPVRSERERQLRSRYGILLEDYQKLLVDQNYVCAVGKRIDFYMLIMITQADILEVCYALGVILLLAF